MAQFVDDHVLDAMNWCFYQIHVQENVAGFRATPPAALHLADQQPWRSLEPKGAKAFNTFPQAMSEGHPSFYWPLPTHNFFSFF